MASCPKTIEISKPEFIFLLAARYDYGPLKTSRDLNWENRTYKLERSIP